MKACPIKQAWHNHYVSMVRSTAKQPPSEVEGIVRFHAAQWFSEFQQISQRREIV